MQLTQLAQWYWIDHSIDYHHQGGEVDGPGRGGAPLPWDMEEPPANMFKEEVLIMMMMMIIVIITIDNDDL